MDTLQPDYFNLFVEFTRQHCPDRWKQVCRDVTDELSYARVQLKEMGRVVADLATQKRLNKSLREELARTNEMLSPKPDRQTVAAQAQDKDDDITTYYDTQKP